MNAVERLGRRKQEARAGLVLARQLQAEPPLEEDPARRLGAIAAGLARGGADKLTLLCSPSLLDFAAEAEERVLRGAGGIVPIAGEPQGKKDAYGLDRLFVSLRLEGESHDATNLADSGHPVVQWTAASEDDLRSAWQGVVDQLRALLGAPSAEPAEASASNEPALQADGFALYADHAQVLRKAAGTLGAQAAGSPASWIAAHLALAEAGDCVALIPRFAEPLRAELSGVQGRIRDVTKLACAAWRHPVRLATARYVELGAPALDLPGALRVDCDDPHRLIELLHRSLQQLSR